MERVRLFCSTEFLLASSFFPRSWLSSLTALGHLPVPSMTISGRPSHSAQTYLLTEHSRAGGLNLNPPALHPRPSPPPVIPNPKFGYAAVIGQA